MEKEIKKYSETFKKELVEEIEQGKLGVEEARIKYGISGKTTINNWLKKYGYFFTGKNENELAKKDKKESALLKRIQELEIELLLYKKLVEVSDFIRNPQ
jgi:Transposase and inactivated derivatives